MTKKERALFDNAFGKDFHPSPRQLSALRNEIEFAKAFGRPMNLHGALKGIDPDFGGEVTEHDSEVTAELGAAIEKGGYLTESAPEKKHKHKHKHSHKHKAEPETPAEVVSEEAAEGSGIDADDVDVVDVSPDPAEAAESTPEPEKKRKHRILRFLNK